MKKDSLTKVKALLISAIVPLTMYWAFNFAGFAGFATNSTWYYWVFINLLFVGVAAGIMATLFVFARRVKAQNPGAYHLYKKIKILCITSFVVIPVAYLFDFFIFIPGAACYALTAINMLIVGALLGLTIYATVKVFKFKTTRTTTTTTKTTTTVRK